MRGLLLFIPFFCSLLVADYQQLENTVQELKEKDPAVHYLIFAKQEKVQTMRMWEVVPYSSAEWSIPKQLRIFWRALSDEPLGSVPLSTSDKPYTPSAAAPSNDPFCNPKVLARQRVFEGRYVELLINYAPMRMNGKPLDDFLIVTKSHKETFDQLTEEEYLEAMELTDKLCRYFFDQNLAIKAYIYHKSGKRAGQTVCHWHLHVTFMKEPIQGAFQKLSIISSSFFHKKLSDKEIETLLLKYNRFKDYINN